MRMLQSHWVRMLWVVLPVGEVARNQLQHGGSGSRIKLFSVEYQWMHMLWSSAYEQHMSEWQDLSGNVSFMGILLVCCIWSTGQCMLHVSQALDKYIR